MGASAEAIGSAIGGLGSMIGSIYSANKNYSSQQETNKMNYQIWQEQLAAQRENWKREQENYLQNRRWQLQDINAERQWNSVQAQAARYRAAGLNPALAMYGGAGQNQVSTTQATPSAPSFDAPVSAPQMVAPTLDLSGLGIGFQSGMNLYLASQRQEADIAALRQHSKNETLQTFSNLIKNGFESGHLKAMTNKLIQDTKFDQESWALRFEGVRLANESIKADMILKEEQAKTQKIINEFKPKEQQKILRNLDKEADRIDSAIRNNDADSAYKAALKGLTDAQSEGVDIDNATKEEYAESVVAYKAAEADLMDFKAQQEGKYLENGDVFGRLAPRGFNPSSGQKTDYRSYHVRNHREMYKDKDGKRKFRNKSVSSGGIR